MPELTNLLLLIGEGAAVAIARGGWRRWAVFAAIAGFVVLSSRQIGELAGNGRADPAPAVALIPAHATVSVDRPRAIAVIEVTAAAAHKPVTENPCGDWLFVDRDGDEPFPAAPVRCGHGYHPVLGADPTGLSGTHWRLYRRD